MKDKNENKRASVAFNAIDPITIDYEVKAVEKEVSGKDFISWGEHNEYPNYLYDLYTSVPSLCSIINSVVDYVKGDKVESHVVMLDENEMTDVIEAMAYNYATYGNVFIEVLRNKLGQVCKINVLDTKDIRSDKKGNRYFYSEDWSKSWGRVKYLELNKFDKDSADAQSIYHIKHTRYTTYGLPIYAAAVSAAEIERNINNFQLNEVHQGFMSNILLSFNNGIPSDEQKEEIEKAVYEKFEGYENAGRPLINYANDKDHGLEVTKIDTDGFIDRYESAQKRAREEIFASWRLNPNLVGITTESLGFNSEEYESSFKLANKTLIQPIQRKIVNALNEIFDTDAVEIQPFTLSLTENNEVQNNEVSDGEDTIN